MKGTPKMREYLRSRKKKTSLLNSISKSQSQRSKNRMSLKSPQILNSLKISNSPKSPKKSR